MSRKIERARMRATRGSSPERSAGIKLGEEVVLVCIAFSNIQGLGRVAFERIIGFSHSD